MDPNFLSESEIAYWCEEYPELSKEEVIEILMVLEESKTSDPLYHSDNNEAS